MHSRNLSDLHKNSARDGGTSGRPTQGGNPVRSATVAIDQEAQRDALGTVRGIGADLDSLMLRAARLSGFLGDDVPLASAVLGAIESASEEALQQLPALRQAIRDIPLMEKGGRSS